MSLVQNFVDGKFTVSTLGDFVEVRSPSTGLEIAKVPISIINDVDEAVKAAEMALGSWKTQSIKSRAALMLKWRSHFEANFDDLADIMMLETGKLITEARAEIEKVKDTIDFAATLHQFVSGRQIQSSAGMSCQENRQCIGVVAAIAPANSPGK